MGSGDATCNTAPIPLARATSADDVTSLVFDAYDGDGIYFLALGDAFLVRPEGANGGGSNARGATRYACVGSAYAIQE